MLTGIVEAEDGGFNAYCPELGVATCGDTVEEVLDGLSDAIRVYLEDWDAPDELERMLRESGVSVKTAPPPAASVNVSIPPGKTVRVYIQSIPAAVPV